MNHVGHSESFFTPLTSAVPRTIRDCDTWPTMEAYVASYHKEEELSTSDMAKKSCWFDFLMGSLSYCSISLNDWSHRLGPKISGTPLYVGVQSQNRFTFCQLFRNLKSQWSSGCLLEWLRVTPSWHIGHRERDRTHHMQNCFKRLRLYHSILEMCPSVFLRSKSCFWLLGCCQFDLGSSFWKIISSAILCTQPSCKAVESDQHLFFECEYTAHLWLDLLAI